MFRPLIEPQHTKYKKYCLFKKRGSLCSEKQSLYVFFSKSTAGIKKKKNLAVCPDYHSHMEFLSSLLNTVSSQSEAYFGAGTKLTVLGKKIN